MTTSGSREEKSRFMDAMWFSRLNEGSDALASREFTELLTDASPSKARAKPLVRSAGQSSALPSI